MAKNEIHFKNTDDCIKKIKSIRTMYRDTTPSYVALSDAIQALEEIQQYRAIGTVEEFKALKEDKKFLEFLYNQILPNEMEQYLSMYRTKDKVAVNEYTDQSGLMPAT